MAISSVHCCQCHALIYAEDSVFSRLRETHAMFYCLNGHEQHFAGRTAIEKERDEYKLRAERAEREAATARERVARIEREAKLNANACKHCPKKFETSDKLRAHIKRVHTKTLRLPADAGESN